MNITIARIRSNVKYNGPLGTVLDSFFENYVRWTRDNPQHKYFILVKVKLKNYKGKVSVRY